jgi:hypothetical protein
LVWLKEFNAAFSTRFHSGFHSNHSGRFADPGANCVFSIGGIEAANPQSEKDDTGRSLRNSWSHVFSFGVGESAISIGRHNGYPIIRACFCKC